MVIALLDGRRRGGHETEGVREIGEFVLAVQLALNHLPIGQFGQSGTKLGVGELRHVPII